MIYELQVEFHKDFVEINENKIIIGIKSKPIKGEANKEIIKKLAKHFGVSTSLVRIRTGQKSREKIVEIQD
ncbi:MAG: hypothetical protein COW27_01450 [Nitrosopumilales archaeon CG15_BIG_FIL_POST_REV_8_21_14_020_37_12]|nr:MAG: hypothetical protein COW27_01450 [Nitrosopumilales archaeon CG15_BIG_FIL_POST_REV_8_21_14_020_37_12]